VDADDLPSGRKMPPYPLPILRVARRAVDQSARGRGLGKALLRFCLELAEGMRDQYGCVGVVVDAKPGAEAFYEPFGFVEVEAMEGMGTRLPRPVLMYLPLGSIPRKPSGR
jgi:predicted N-acetyltransferase YhbS